MHSNTGVAPRRRPEPEEPDMSRVNAAAPDHPLVAADAQPVGGRIRPPVGIGGSHRTSLGLSGMCLRPCAQRRLPLLPKR